MEKRTALIFIIIALITILAAQKILSESKVSYYSADGYGYIMERKGQECRFYDVTDISRIHFMSAKLDKDNRGYLRPVGAQGFLATLTGQGFPVKINEESYELENHKYALSKIEKFPAANVTLPTEDPLINFDVFCREVELYSIAFNHHPELDWDSLKKKMRGRISSKTTEDELFSIMGEMIVPLHDAHTTLTSTENEALSVPDPRILRDIKTRGLKSFSETLKQKYVQLQKGKTKRIRWGKLNGTTYGYIVVTGFMEMVENGNNNFDEEVIAVKSDLRSAAEYLKECSDIVVDLRFNGGGHDYFAQMLSSMFIENRVLIYTKEYRTGRPEEFSAAVPYYLEPSPFTLKNKRVCVLTSEMTVSAAECALMCMRTVPGCRQIGEKTQGAFSDALFRVLPNGWELTLSNERYLDPAGIDYEQKGFEPDIFVPVKLEDFERGRDLSLEKAIELFEKKPD